MIRQILLLVGLLCVRSVTQAQIQVGAPPDPKAAVVTADHVVITQPKIVADKKESSDFGFTFETFGVLQTADLDTEDHGIGIGGVIDLGQYFGVGIEGYSFGTDGVFVDRAAISGRYNIVTGSKSKPYLFGGYWHDFEQDVNGFHLGVGGSHQFAKWVKPFADVRFHKPLDGPDTAPSAVVRAGLSASF